MRQIVVETLRREDEAARDHRFVEAARLAPALKLTLGKVAEEKLEAVDRLDKYLGGAATNFDQKDVREKLLRRINMALSAPDCLETQASPDQAPPAPPSQPLEMSQNDQDFPWTGARHWGR